MCVPSPVLAFCSLPSLKSDFQTYKASQLSVESVKCRLGFAGMDCFTWHQVSRSSCAATPQTKAVGSEAEAQMLTHG